jgi:hypothetical protein
MAAWLHVAAFVVTMAALLHLSVMNLPEVNFPEYEVNWNIPPLSVLGGQGAGELLGGSWCCYWSCCTAVLLLLLLYCCCTAALVTSGIGNYKHVPVRRL